MLKSQGKGNNLSARYGIYSPLDPSFIGGFRTWLATFWQPYLERVDATLRFIHLGMRPVAEESAYRDLAFGDRVEVHEISPTLALGSNRWPKYTELRESLVGLDALYFDNGYQLHDLPVLRAAQEVGVPVVSGHHAVIVHEGDRSLMSIAHNLLWNYIGLRQMQRFSAIHVLNNADAMYFGKRGLQKVHETALPIDLSVFRPNSKFEHFTVMFVGRLTHQKGIDRLVALLRTYNANHSLPNVHFLIIGDGPDRAMLSDLEVESNIEICGARTSSECAELLAKSHLLIMPSRSETFGIVAAEAMSCGTPVCATSLPAMERRVKESGGLTIACPDDPAMWTQAISDIASEYSDKPQQYHLRALSAREYAETHFSFEALAQSFDRLLNSTLLS